MSRIGLEAPNSVPFTVFWKSVITAPDRWMVSFVGSARPVMTSVPPLRMTSKPAWTTSSLDDVDGDDRLVGADAPGQLRARAPAPRAALATAWVAPICSAISRLLASGSMATMFVAPAHAAPWTALMPIPPMP